MHMGRHTRTNNRGCLRTGSRHLHSVLELWSDVSERSAPSSPPRKTFVISFHAAAQSSRSRSSNRHRRHLRTATRRLVPTLPHCQGLQCGAGGVPADHRSHLRLATTLVSNSISTISPSLFSPESCQHRLLFSNSQRSSAPRIYHRHVHLEQRLSRWSGHNLFLGWFVLAPRGHPPAFMIASFCAISAACISAMNFSFHAWGCSM